MNDKTNKDRIFLDTTVGIQFKRVSNFIPAIHLIIEDDLAQEVLDVTLNQLGDGRPSVKYTKAGSWVNQISILYGFYTYGNLIQNYNIPAFSIIAINDGDIEKREFSTKIEKTIKFHHSPEQNLIKDKIKNSAICFNLEIIDYSIKALPEYNHKLWFEQITMSTLLKYHKEDLRHVDFHHKQDCKFDIIVLIRLINFSKNIQDADLTRNGKIDYHLYYDALKNFVPPRPCHRMNNIVWFVLESIKKYNPNKWDFYTKAVLEHILKVSEENKSKFQNSKIKLG